MHKGSSSLIAPAYAGVAFYFSWTYLVFYASTAGIEAAAPISLMSSGYMASAVTLIATLLIIAFTSFRQRDLLLHTAMKIATGLVMPIGTVVLIWGGLLGHLPLIIFGGLITGVASGVLSMQWVFLYKRVSIKIAICSFPTLMAVSVCTCLTLMYLPRTAMLICTAVLPLLSELMVHLVRLELMPKHMVESGPKNKPTNFLMVLVPIALFFLASGFLDFYSSGSVYTYVFYALAAFIPLAIAVVFIFVTSREDCVACAVVPVCCLAVAFVPMLSLHNYLPSAQFISIGELGIEVVVFITVVAFSEFFDLGFFKVYALARTCMTLFNSLGWYLAQAVNEAASSLAYYQLSLVIAFVGIEALTICIIVSIVKVRKSEKIQDDVEEPDQSNATQQEPTTAALNHPADVSEQEASQDKPEESADERFQRRCREVCETYALSSREADVLELLARGYTAARIQQELFIAAGTVNYHTRNIYNKLGVHTKQEIIELIERD